jgi:PAS domain S-box-containing protein
MSDYTRTTLELLYNISRELTSDLDLHTVLGRVLSLSSKYVGAERASVIVLDDLRPVDAATIVHDRLMPQTVEDLRGILDQGLAGWVVRNRQAAMLSDTSRDERWLHRPDDSANRTGAKSAICVPVIARDKLVGVLTIVHPQPQFFNIEHLALVQAIADQAGIAINNARLYNSLQAAHRRYHELFDASIDPIWITNLNGCLLEENREAARLTGNESHAMQGRSAAELLQLNTGWLEAQAEDLKEGKTVHVETTLINHSGSVAPVDVYVSKVTMDAEESLQWILRDISERKALDALRDDLMAMVYHDLRSPLSNIISSLEMFNMLLPVSENDNLRAILTIASRSSERMQRLIATLLDIYRLEAGQAIASHKETEILPLAYEAIDAVQPVAENKGQEMKVEVEKNLPPVWIDPDMIRRVIINLLDNATKFTLFKGEIALTIRRVSGLNTASGEMIEFTVSDNGPGIPSDKLELIFDKFARLQVERFPKGLGLGLAFCKLAVRAHGGDIWVESQVGKGSKFIFTLPVGAGPQETAGDDTASPGSPGNL